MALAGKNRAKKAGIIANQLVDGFVTLLRVLDCYHVSCAARKVFEFSPSSRTIRCSPLAVVRAQIHSVEFGVFFPKRAN